MQVSNGEDKAEWHLETMPEDEALEMHLRWLGETNRVMTRLLSPICRKAAAEGASYRGTCA